jgi:zinc transport system ATP-binding protein
MARLKKPILEVKDVSFSFGSTKVLSKISFYIEKGDFLAIIGPNGSGKTTLIKLMMGLYSANQGDIRIFGKSIKEFKGWSKLGYVPQKATSIEEQFPATVEEVVTMGLLSQKSFPKIIRAQDTRKVSNVLKIVRMQEYANRRIGELSGGQQQRVLIAKALIGEPEIIILDEPTTGVDQEAQKTFYDLLHTLNQKGITIILISHDVGRITQYVTKIASLNQKLEFYGTHREFCKFDKNHKHIMHSHDVCLDRG